MRPFFGIVPVLMDEKVCEGLTEVTPSSMGTLTISLVFLLFFLASFAYSPTPHVPRVWWLVERACALLQHAPQILPLETQWIKSPRGVSPVYPQKPSRRQFLQRTLVIFLPLAKQLGG